MKKNLTIIAIALVVLAMAVPDSAASLSLTGKAVAGFKYDYKSGNEFWNFETLATNSRLELNLTFKEGDKITAYLPLIVRPVLGFPEIIRADKVNAVGGWYFAYDSAPVAFWLSSNDYYNAKKWAPLGDPMKVVHEMPAVVLLNVNGEVLGANFNLYSADLGTRTLSAKVGKTWDVDKEEWVETEKKELGTASDGNAWIGRITYPLPFDFTLGAFGVYTDGVQEDNSDTLVTDEKGVVDPDDYEDYTFAVSSVRDNLIFGGDLIGKIPALGEDANLTLALAGQWTKTGVWKFEGGTDNLAYIAKLSDVQVGPVSAWASYTAVGIDFDSPYRIPVAKGEDRWAEEILNHYRNWHADPDDEDKSYATGAAAAEAEVAVELPIGLPATLTIGDTLWMEYPANPKYNETTAELVISPLENLAVTVSGAYITDLDKADIPGDPDADPVIPDVDEVFKGYSVYGGVEYKAFGLSIKPYVEYDTDYYADDTPHTDGKVVDTIVGLKVKGTPLPGLDLNVNGKYTIEEPKTSVFAWGVYTSEFNPGFVKGAKTQIAAAGEYKKEAEAEATTYYLGYLGSDLVVTDQLSAKVGVLTKDSTKKPVAHAALTYKVSDSVTTTLAYTYRAGGVMPSYSGMWRPFEDNGKNFVKASIKGTVGKSTIELAYGNAGLALKGCAFSRGCDLDLDKADHHISKPWTWLYHEPGFGGAQENFMNWQLFSISCSVPF